MGTPPALQNFDPPTYFILSQFKLVITGVVFQIVFRKKLSTRQWGSLFIIFLGCSLKELPNMPFLSATAPPVAGGAGGAHVLHLLLMLTQLLCSTFAGVYNESLLKNQTAPVNLQNVYMCVQLSCNAER